ncbi:GTP 3',8-cyclase MoaA [Parvularcula maris]|uniref:GTP 3',8-cyclase n=1 Tax=Parvularcula maris TaxID=2965077 RepID=A0A9X2RJN2_9PROT|nr:GTP 3',8-cyclase MoaA [Parvularcula maris]MCQ8184862.1 GTP 3',8-cyclase MoaA [Parvularcula maris]
MAYDGQPIARPLTDGMGRTISYLRLSVTDRCDLRCTYCMAERPDFLPRRDLLTPDEIDRLAEAFISRGVSKLRLTGGEPLVRRDFAGIVRRLGRHVRSGALDELTLTTNATLLAQHAVLLADSGVRRINVSLDSLDPETYRRVTRGGDLSKALDGIGAAHQQGIRIKINVVALREDNAQELPGIIAWAHGEGHDVSIIEVMPMAETGVDRRRQFLPLSAVREELEKRWTLTPSAHRTGGPSRYWEVAETGGRLGFITPLTNNFCEGCNRVRVTATGRLVLCLGQEDGTDLRSVLRSGDGQALDDTIDRALLGKPERHGFEEAYAAGTQAVTRGMNTTGG